MNFFFVILLIIQKNINKFPMKNKKPSDYTKFYDFSVSAEKLKKFQNNIKFMSFRHFRNAFIFGALIEYMIMKSQICEFFHF